MNVRILLGIVCCHYQKYLALYVTVRLFTIGNFRPLGSVNMVEIAKPEEMKLFVRLNLRARPFRKSLNNLGSSPWAEGEVEHLTE